MPTVGAELAAQDLSTSTTETNSHDFRSTPAFILIPRLNVTASEGLSKGGSSQHCTANVGPEAWAGAIFVIAVTYFWALPDPRDLRSRGAARTLLRDQVDFHSLGACRAAKGSGSRLSFG